MSETREQSGEETAALARAADLGIHRIPLPTPFSVGDINTYLLDGDPLTLVDCGPNSASALLALEDGLAGLGRRIDDIGLVLVTHQHIDHVGLASAIAARAGADVACLDLLAPVLEDWERHAVQDDDDALLVMRRHGVEDHVADALRSVADVVRGWGGEGGIPIARTFRAGDLLTVGDRELRVLHRPGHSASDTLFVDETSGIALTGDHLIAGISSNAILSRPLGEWDGSRPRPLLAYRASLRETRDSGIELALGGHRAPVTDVTGLIDSRLADHERRAERFAKTLADGPLTAHEIATATWGHVAITQAFLTLSEVIGHLDLLIEEGVVLEDRSEQVVRFSLR